MTKSSNKKDFFISYTKKNEDWATWIAETLERNGYTTVIQAWDFQAGGTFISDMHEALKKCVKIIPVLSSEYLNKPYCLAEWQNVFVDDPTGEKRLIIPIRIEDVKPEGLLKTRTYIDLFGLNESDATVKLLDCIATGSKKRKSNGFPLKSCFPGELAANTLSDGNSCFIAHKKVRNIIILETEKKTKKRLFNRLVFDVFHALGFGEPRYDLPKHRREISMVLQHRTENRFALIACKAQTEKVSSADINKFVGALDVERGKYERDGDSVVGYFITQTGFSATALEQEDERAEIKKGKNQKSGVILLGPDEIARELIQGNVICSLERAATAVKQFSGNMLSLCEYVDLIACEQGWIWVLYYAHLPRQAATHFAFVHADGNQLLNSIAALLINQARSKTVAFSDLTYIAASSDILLDKQAARDAYFKYLENELGEIQFEGMPTDKEAGAIKVNLESIFVPLRFNCENSSSIGSEPQLEQQTSIEGVLSRTYRAAILAKPGGGKSTLIRRIALAYACPERRIRVDDGLPDFDWFPIYIRCRDLGEDATKSIFDIIGTIVYRAEITKHKHPFESLVEDTLQNGQALFLIDGLDEISNEKYRICFINQLRTFVATYPTVHLLITSREAGFRAVAGTLSSYCERYSIASLQEKEIRYLSLKWHQAILGESDQTETDSNKVCDIIMNDPRIIALADNPLLLTTLLFVKRWVGYLPTKKCRLYEEMIKLLLVTWNAVAHDKLDMDETEPQLAFVAYCMTKQGQQKITRDELDKCIIAARKALPELLGYTTVSAARFIDQVEERSSLLIQLGLEENSKGQWVPSYEFSHLSFQEYLSAKAITEGWIPDSDCNALLDVLKPHINEDHWKEVIPLVAVLLGRYAKPLVEHLIELCEKDKSYDDSIFFKERMDPENIAPVHLANCIASEVPMSQELLEKSIILVVERKRVIEKVNRRRLGSPVSINVFDTIIKSKYGSNYQDVVKNVLFGNLQDECTYQFMDAWLNIYTLASGECNNPSKILQLLKSNNYENRVTGALFMMRFAYNRKNVLLKPKTVHVDKSNVEDTATITEIFSIIFHLLQTDNTLYIYSAAWCIAWSGYNEADIIPHEISPSITKRLSDLWQRNIMPDRLKRMISWALYSVCMPNLQNGVFEDIPKLTKVIEENYLNPKNDFDAYTAIHLAVLTNSWTKEITRKRLSFSDKEYHYPQKENSRFLIESGFYEQKGKA